MSVMPLERDQLIGSLLALRELMARAETGQPASSVEELYVVLDQLLHVCDHIAGFPAHAFGMPPFAVADLTRLEDMLMGTDTAEAWSSAWQDAAARSRVIECETDIGTLALCVDEDLRPPVAVLRALGRDVPQLAAATGLHPGREQDDQEADERLASGRATRCDVIVLDTETADRDVPEGAVLGLDLVYGGGDELQPTRVLSRSFVDGIKAGHRAALALLKDLRLPEAALERIRAVPFASVPGLLPPASLQEGSAALPVALATLRAAAWQIGVDLGPPRALATGAIQGNVVSPAPRSISCAKMRLVARDMCFERLIVPPVVAGDPALEAPVVAVDRLETAAEAAWGLSWVAFARNLAEAHLSHLGYRIAHGTGGLEEGIGLGLEEVPLVEVRQLLQEFDRGRRRSDPWFGVIGGPSRTGKTTIVRQLARQLHEQTGRDDVLWVEVPGQREAHHPDEFVAHLRLLTRSAPPTTLLVLEGFDLAHHGEYALLDEVLQRAAKGTGLPVLATARYDEGHGRWTADRIKSYVPVVGEAKETRFVNELIAANPQLEPARGEAGRALDIARGDLWLLSSYLLWLSTAPPDVDDRSIRNAYIGHVAADLSEDALETVKILAALSLLDMTTPNRILHAGAVTPADLARIGARRRGDGWIMPSRWVARTLLLTQAGAAEPMAGAMAAIMMSEHVAQAVDHFLLESPSVNRDQQIATLLAAAERTDDEMLVYVVERCRLFAGGDRWSKDADPYALAKVLKRIGWTLHRELLKQAVNDLAGLVMRRGTPSVRQLTVELQTLARHGHLLDSRANAWRGQLEGFVRTTLLTAFATRSDGIAARSQLVEAILRSGFERPDLVFDARGLDRLFGGLDPKNASHYRAAGDIANELLKRHQSWLPIGSHGGSREAAHLIAQVPGVRELLEPPAAHDSVGVLLGWLALCERLHFDPFGDRRQPDWDELVNDVISYASAGLEREPISEITKALTHLVTHARGLAVRLLQRARIGETLARRLTSSAPLGDRAALLTTIYELHAATARSMLYLGDEPHRELASALSRRARASNDPRGIGLFLRAAGRIDNDFGMPSDGFAHAFAETLMAKYVTTVLSVEPRTSVVYHLLHALADARASFLPESVEQSMDLVVRTIERSGKSWAPRLALLLATDPISGEDVLARLAEDLDVPQDDPTWQAPRRHPLRRRLVDTRRVDAIVHTHRLVAALDPPQAPLARGFFAEWFSPWLDDMVHRGRPEVVAEALLAVSETLQRARPEHSGVDEVFEALAQGGWSWQKQSARVRDIGRLTPMLSTLRKLQPEVAQQIVQHLSQKTVVWTHGNSRLGRLFENYLIEQPEPAATLLTTVERILPGTAASVLEEVAPERLRLFDEELSYIQDHQVQARAYLQLAQVGWLPDKAIMLRLWRSSGPSRSALSKVTNPIALTGLLRVLATWSRMAPDIGLPAVTEVARDIRVERLARRFAAGVPRDLDALPGLLGTLRLCGRPVVEMLDGVVTNPSVLRHMDLDRLVALAVELESQAFEATAVDETIATIVSERLATPFVVDSVDQSLAIGRALATRPDARAPVCFPSVRPRWLPTHAPAAMIACVTALPAGSPWATTTLDEAWPRVVASQPPTRLDHVVPVLVSASLNDRPDVLQAIPPTTLRQAASVDSAGALLALATRSHVDERLQPAVDEIRDVVLARHTSETLSPGLEAVVRSLADISRSE